MRAGTRTITVVFTDMVGSTAAMTRLGPGYERLRTMHFAALRGALAVHHGDEVKTTGDGLMAVFASATDAVTCAVAMQRGASEHSRRRPDLALELRIGVSAGEAAVEGHDFYGVPVVEASRLCDVAAPGQILVSDVVRALIGVQGRHRLAPAGQLALKGLAQPAVVWQAGWDQEEGSPLRVALADDSMLLREGVAKVLEAQGVEVVLQVADAQALVDGVGATCPHVVVVDMRMPPTYTTEGLWAAERIRAEHPDIGVLILSQSVAVGAARRLLRAGSEGIGYLLKERVADVDELVRAIRTVAGGGSAIDPEVGRFET